MQDETRNSSSFLVRFGSVRFSPDAALSEELLQQVVRRLHHEDVVQGHQDAADFSEPSHQAELVERAHRLDRLEGVRADHLKAIIKKTKHNNTMDPSFNFSVGTWTAWNRE